MINNKWDEVLKDEIKKPYFKQLGLFIKDQYKKNTIYPEYQNIFKAFKYTDYDKVKVVILGQDPYHGPNEAQGLSFSVPENIKRPPSLNNIFKELENDLGIKRTNNNLTDWAKQGVFLLNAILTVVAHSPLSHKNKGWETFTDNIIKILNQSENKIVFILWGSYARSKKELITNKNHYIIESPHPSPLSASRGFFGSKPFSKTNNFLVSNGIKPINWGDEDE